MHSFLISVIGDRDKIGTERYFITVACLITSGFLLLITAVHLSLGLNIMPAIIASSSSIIVLGFYYLARFRDWLFIPKLSLTLFGLIMLDLVWYFKFMSHGPVLFFLLIYGALIIWVWERKSLVVLLSVYFLNFGLLFLIESSAEEHIYHSTDYAGIRTIDIYLSIALLSAFMIFLLYLVKREYIRLKDNALKSEKLKTAFLANISHEIRNPMNAIVGFSELLCDKISHQRREQYNNIIYNNCKNLLRLINDILDLSKIDAGDMQIRYSAIDAREFLTELYDIYNLELQKRKRKNVRLGFMIPEQDLIFYSDPLRLKQVLSNLMDNAIKFTLQGKITLTCIKEETELIFSVSDTGTGIPEENQKIIFDRFVKFDYQGHNTEGSGIGLSIVEKIIKLLNGRIWFKSVSGKGSTFFFAIPCYITSPLFKAMIPAITETGPDKSTVQGI